MEMKEILDSVISSLAEAGVPVFHQFDEKLIAKRNECFITVGLSEMTTEIICSTKEQYEIDVLVSLFAPTSYSGGKLLKFSKDIAPLILSSGLDVKSVRACALCYDKPSDRLRYDFEVKIEATGISGSYDAERSAITAVLSQNLSLYVTELCMSRKRALYEVPSVTSEIHVSDNGSAPLRLSLTGSAELGGGTLKALDDLAKSGEALTLTLLGMDFPEMRICDYAVKQTGRETCTAKINLVAAEASEGLSEC